MVDKIVKENETHIWREIENGIGYVYPKNVFWKFLKEEKGYQNDNDPTKDQEITQP